MEPTLRCDWCRRVFVPKNDTWINVFNSRLCHGCYYCWKHGAPRMDERDLNEPEPLEQLDAH